MKMMAALLADRFQLGFHFEKRELPAYIIVVDRNGGKLKPSNGDPTGLPSLASRAVDN